LLLQPLRSLKKLQHTAAQCVYSLVLLLPVLLSWLCSACSCCAVMPLLVRILSPGALRLFREAAAPP
jgi:hypothetical protein